MRFKQRKDYTDREAFVGVLRCNVDKETADLLKAHVVVKQRLIEGKYFIHYADGNVEVKTFNEVAQPMLDNIKARSLKRNAST